MGNKLVLRIHERLETEPINIFLEVITEFERPVMMHTIGKVSSVMLYLAHKFFYPNPIPFPLLNVVLL
jgi:sulfate adenylyltransferase subunit 2